VYARVSNKSNNQLEFSDVWMTTMNPLANLNCRKNIDVTFNLKDSKYVILHYLFIHSNHNSQTIIRLYFRLKDRIYSMYFLSTIKKQNYRLRVVNLVLTHFAKFISVQMNM